MNAFPESYTRGAHLLRELQQLKPGQNYRIEWETLSRIQVPAHPLDVQNTEFIARWMHERLPFYSTLHQGMVGGWWEIRRPVFAKQQEHEPADGWLPDGSWKP